ncbi:SlyX family protein [Phreatobacter oligotrophus]|jgi:SlyX protein|uniref:SlyX family protein n=1 Tax=Phreatobacter oligotrophus TaxID=1122261 RepID=UPI0023540769|nr:SlyX family protein [Phreatobacter oligotrophus]MBX9990263.1 SlyX family protein [Phreatobacter oligotrophus]
MSDVNDLTGRLEALEIRVAYQDQTIEDLNATITAQWQELERLKRMIQRLEDQVREAEASAGGPNLPEPPPPHY